MIARTWMAVWCWVAGRLMGALLVASVLLPSDALAQEVRGEVSFETRGFVHSPLDGEQRRHDGSLVLSPELWIEGLGAGITFEPFLRLDLSDGARSHFDIRELSWERSWMDWELRLGLRRVFWGVTESNHLVDVINQTDLVENPDGEDKLGQPMVNLAWVQGWGTLDAFLLLGFRERTFPGVDGRLRPSLPVDRANPVYASGAEGSRLDWALRWSHAWGDWDVGLAHFNGTNREPRLVPDFRPEGAVLVPHYDVIAQWGLDAQWTKGAWLWKFEGLTRSGLPEGRFWAMTAGLEYTLYQPFGGDADLGVLAEVLLDDRGSAATTPFQDDLFVGARLALNDVASTSLLAGGIVDRETGATLMTLEASRRLSDHWTVEVQARAFLGLGAGEPLHDLRRDDHFLLAVRRYF